MKLVFASLVKVLLLGAALCLASWPCAFAEDGSGNFFRPSSPSAKGSFYEGTKIPRKSAFSSSGRDTKFARKPQQPRKPAEARKPQKLRKPADPKRPMQPRNPAKPRLAQPKR